EIGIGRFPSLHHRKEGWPSDQKIIAKPLLIARPGWFSDENKRKTTPAASASVAARNLLDDAATPPCGDARRGITLDSNLFHSSYDRRPCLASASWAVIDAPTEKAVCRELWESPYL